MGASLSVLANRDRRHHLSQEVLEKSKAHLQPVRMQRGLPIQMLVNHFTQINETWQLSPEIRAMVQFKQLNLLHAFSAPRQPSTSSSPQVLIYFDQGTKVNVFNRLAKVIEPDGFLRARRGGNGGRPERGLQSVSERRASIIRRPRRRKTARRRWCDGGRREACDRRTLM